MNRIEGRRKADRKTETEREQAAGSAEARDLSVRIVAACGIFLLLFLSGHFAGVPEKETVQTWVRENGAYERLVETTAQAVRERLPGLSK